jgi:hypothetical protein
VYPNYSHDDKLNNAHYSYESKQREREIREGKAGQSKIRGQDG